MNPIQILSLEPNQSASPGLMSGLLDNKGLGNLMMKNNINSFAIDNPISISHLGDA